MTFTTFRVQMATVYYTVLSGTRGSRQTYVEITGCVYVGVISSLGLNGDKNMHGLVFVLSESKSRTRRDDADIHPVHFSRRTVDNH